jgi:hypothetical protein
VDSKGRKSYIAVLTICIKDPRMIMKNKMRPSSPLHLLGFHRSPPSPSSGIEPLRRESMKNTSENP